MLFKNMSILCGVGGLLVGSYAIADTDSPTSEISAKEELLNLITDEAMITSVKNDLVIDERLAYMVSHELMVQKLMQEEEFISKIQDGLAQNSEPRQRKKLTEKVSMTLMKMMGDEEAKKRVIKDVMVRQIAAKQRKLMGGTGAKE